LNWKSSLIASAVDSLMCAQVCIRPDIDFVVNALGRYLSDPGLGHWKAIKRSLNICREPRITCWPIGSMINFRSFVILILFFFYSGFDGCTDDRKSISSFGFMMEGEAISWKRVKQTLIATPEGSMLLVMKHLSNYVAKNLLFDF